MAAKKQKSGIDKLSLKETRKQLKKTVGSIEENIKTLDDVDEDDEKTSTPTRNNLKENIEKGKALSIHLRDLLQKAKKENKADKSPS